MSRKTRYELYYLIIHNMNIFTLPDEDEVLTDKLNLDDLFEKKREISETKLGLYNKVLNRIHHKIN